MVDDVVPDGWHQVLRQHRHDVQNGLQLISGYIQLGRPERAEDATLRMATWLRTISWIQTLAEDGDYEQWLKASHMAPHVHLNGRPELNRLSPEADAMLAQAWLWLEEIATLHGLMEIGLAVMGQDEDGAQRCDICVDWINECETWWAHRPKLTGVEWVLMDRK